MAIEHSVIQTLLNGVSQQADAIRFASQGNLQENCVSNNVGGLGKRAPAEFIAEIYNGIDLTDAFYHFINRSDTEKYLIVIHGGTNPQIDAWNVLTGASVSVVKTGGGALTPSDLTYLRSSLGAFKELKGLTIGDTTIILNRGVTAGKGSTLSSTRNPEALVFVKNATSSAVVGVQLRNTQGGSNDYSVTYNTLAGDNQQDIAAGLVSALNTASANAVYTYSASNGVIHIKKTDNSDFGITVTDETGGNAYSIKESVSALADLPQEAYVGFKVKIDGDPNSTDDNPYYVQFTSVETGITSGFHQGQWEETTADGIEVDLESASMPHKIVSNGSVFEFGPITWVNRLIGDDNSNAYPTFINSTIDDLFFFNNRLGFLSRENAIFSVDGDFFNFFRESAIDLLDTDRIDITVGGSAEDVVFLRHAIPKEGELLIFSDNLEFVVSSEGAFTPAQVSATLVGRVQADSDVKPVALGSSFYFPFTRGNFVGINEYFRVDEFQPFKAVEITEHVPNYLKGDVRWITGSSQQNTVMVGADDDLKSVFVYNFLDRDNQRLQSAWHKFTFKGDVRFAFFDGPTMYIVTTYSNNITELHKLGLEHGRRDGSLAFSVMMDRRIDESKIVSSSYDVNQDDTILTLPYTPSGTIQVAMRETGEVLNNVSFDGSMVTIGGGDFTSSNLYIGEQYVAKYEPTRPYVRAGEPPTVVRNVTFYVSHLVVDYDDTAIFGVSVSNEGSDTYTYEFDSRDFTDPSVLVGGVPALKDGSFVVPVFDNSKYISVTLSNSSPLPCNFTGLTWMGQALRIR